MFPKLSKSIIIALLTAKACTAASIAWWNANDGVVDQTWENAKAATVCTVGVNDPQLCWNNTMAHHVFVGNPTTCHGTHVSSAVVQAYMAGTITSLQVVNSNLMTGLMELSWNGGGRTCWKTVWNDLQNFPPGQPVPPYTAQNITDICIDTMTRNLCMSGSIVVSDGYGGRICVYVHIGTLPSPGRTCYPKGIYAQGGNIGDPC